MKKTILVGLLCFALGGGLAFLVLANPLGWHWIDSLQARLMSNASLSGDAAQDGQLWTCGMHPQVIRDEPGTCPICGMTLVPVKDSSGTTPAEGASASGGERKIKYWRAPMDPTYISDKPGKSPMGMDLIPVYEDEAEAPAPGTVRIDPAFVQNIGVQSEPVMRGDIPFEIRTVGTLSYNDRQISWLTTRYSGWIEKVYVNYVGEFVRKGQKLFEIYSPELVSTQTEYLNAVEYAERMADSGYPDMIKRARSLVESSRRRLMYWDISDDEIEELEKTRKVRRTLPVLASSSGLIVEKMNQALDGMFVKPGMNLYKIVDLSTIWVDAEVFENQIPWLKVGQSATVEIPYQPGKEYRARVRFIYPYFSDKTRTLKLSLELPNPGWKLRADMYANVIFEVPSVRDVLIVPEESVIHSGTRNIVVVDGGNGSFQVKEVVLGVNGNGVYEIKEGLEEGDQVVVSSQFLIDSESNLKEAIRKLVSASGKDEKTPASAPAHQH